MNYTQKSDLGPDKQRKFDNINQMIKLSVITLVASTVLNYLSQNIITLQVWSGERLVLLYR
jgi:hypothetical protein